MSRLYRTDSPAATWEIRDRHGAVQAVHERYDKPDGKDCFWRLPDGTLKEGLQGRKLETLPLFGSHELDDEAVLTVVVEGEKAHDALARALQGTGVNVLGTVTGAAQTPSPAVLEALRNHEVTLWPDADGPGIAHMARIAKHLEGIAAKVRLYTWHDAPEKGDAADHPAVKSGNEKAVGILLNDLSGAPEYTEPEPVASTTRTFERVDLAGALERGVDPPGVLIPELLLAGKVHCVYSAGGTGKTFYAAYLTKRVLEDGGTVVYFDQENGLRIMAERAECVGITPGMARRLYYYPFPTMPLDREVVEEYEALLDEIDPDLVVFDSWVNLLAVCGLDENSSIDIATWAEAYSQKARHRGMAALLLDHTPKDGGSARGSGRKLDYVDVMWELKNPQKFDRTKVGRIDLHLRKDREGWLPSVHTFSVGGGEDGFVFSPSKGTTGYRDATGLSVKERATLTALEAFGLDGATNKEWENGAAEADVGRSSYYDARRRLLDLELVERVGDRYFAKSLQTESPEQSSGRPLDYAGVSSPESPVSLGTGLLDSPVDGPADTDPLRCYLDESPSWLGQQLRLCRENERLIPATCSTIAYEVYGTGSRHAEVRPHIEELLKAGMRAGGAE